MRLPRLVLFGLLTLGAATSAAAQGAIKNRLTLSGITITFPTVTEANYDAGFVAASNSITFTFDASKAGGANSGTQRTSIVSVKATTTTMGGTKAIGDLQWRRSDLATWNSLSTTDATIESRQFVFNGLNDPWSNTVFFRTVLNWATDTPATYSATLTFTLTITTP
ncbi:MAG TPA: hypothetical protein VF454_06405 [Gemmatimonadales bacterium]